MRRRTALFMILLLAASTTCWAQHKKPAGPEIVDPAVAAEDPDFHVQGEYVGQMEADGKKLKIGAQVIARGEGRFEVFLLDGGLPGDGWTRDRERAGTTAVREGDVTTFDGETASGEIRDGKMTLRCKTAGDTMTLERVERSSPTLGARPAKGAKVLFGDGEPRFEPVVLSDDGNLVAGTTTKEKFESFRLHLEFRLSWKPWAGGQARSNSGVYVHDCYEIQVLDAFGLEGKDNECGGLYKVKEPDVNMCLPPLVWQTYDIELVGPKYDAAGEKSDNARLSVRHNGVVIHEDVVLPKETPGRQKEGPGPRPIHLQGHGNRVQYRNIWIVPR